MNEVRELVAGTPTTAIRVIVSADTEGGKTEQGTGHIQRPTDIPLLQITTLSWLLQATLLADRHLDFTLFGLLLFSINIVVRSIKRLQFKIQM